MRSEPTDPAEHLRLALLDLQQAHREFALSYGTAHADAAAASADEARTLAARWAALARAADRLEE